VQVPTPAFRVNACSSHLNCHLLPAQGEPKGNPELQSPAHHHGALLSKKEERRKEGSIYALTPNSCQAMEEIWRFGTLVNQQRTLKALGGSKGTSWTLLKPFHWPNWDQNFTLCPQAGRSCFSEHTASSSENASSWLSRISYDCINENSGPQGAKCTQKLIGVAATAAGLSKRVCCYRSLSRTFHVEQGKWASVCPLVSLILASDGLCFDNK